MVWCAWRGGTAVREFGIGPRRIARQMRRNAELELHKKERLEKAKGHIDLRFGVPRRLEARELGSLEVEVFPECRQVRL